jgi:hypothetical protein
MRFIWVNGRAPLSHSVCAACDRLIGSAYLRHIETRLFFCDPGCYASVRVDNLGIGSFTLYQPGAVPESALTFLHHNRDSDLAY